jgi:hypothetical protein
MRASYASFVVVISVRRAEPSEYTVTGALKRLLCKAVHQGRPAPGTALSRGI